MDQREWTVMTPEKLPVYAREWAPPVAKGAIVLVHGLGEHVQRYSHVAQSLTGAGYSLVGFDLPGHGKTPGTRGHIPSYPMVMDLITRMLEETNAKYPHLPHFLYGHSLGGNLVLYYAIHEKPRLSGVIVTSPGLGTSVPVPAWKTALGKVLYNMAPSFQMDNGLDITGLSHDQAVVEAYRKDPLVHPKVSTRLGLDTLANGRWIVEHASEFPPVPLLLMQGSADRVIDPKLTKRFADCFRGDLSFKMWEDGYHELHNEPNKQEVLKTMIEWLDEHLPA